MNGHSESSVFALPGETAFETGAEWPMREDVFTMGQAGALTTESLGLETPHASAVYESSLETTYEDNPYEANLASPYESAFESGFESSLESVYEDSPYESAFESGFESSLESVYEDSPYESAVGTGFESLETIYEDNPYESAVESGFENAQLGTECTCREHGPAEFSQHENGRKKPVPPHVVQFLRTYRPNADASQAATGVPALVTLGQAALESGWGRKAPGFNFFGIKARPTDPEATRQLMVTREVLSRPDARFPQVISVTRRRDGRYDYVVRDWFRRYASAPDAFVAHGRLLRRNARYSRAFSTSDPYEFARAVAAAGYATDPGYAQALTGVMRLIERVPSGRASATVAPARPAARTTPGTPPAPSAPVDPAPAPAAGAPSIPRASVPIPALQVPSSPCLTGSDAPLDRALRAPNPGADRFEGRPEIAAFASALAQVQAQRKAQDPSKRAQLAAEYEAWLAKDYTATLVAGLNRYGATWRTRMQKQVEARRRSLARARRGPLTATDRVALEAERCGQETWWLARLTGLRKGWMVGRREQVDFNTLMGPYPRLPNFNPPPLPAGSAPTFVPIEPLGSGTPIAAETQKFLAELSRRAGNTYSANNYPRHGGGTFVGRGYSLDLYLNAQLDERGFYPRDRAVVFLMAVGAAASATGLRWRVLYNDYAVAAEVNRRTGSYNVMFMGQSSKALNWHGPLILHFHLDLAP